MTVRARKPARRAASPDKAPKRPDPQVGDFVLCGSSTASLPGDWFLGQVLWAAKGDVLIERSTRNGQTWREVAHVSEVRAVGSIAELGAVQEAARIAVQDLHRAVHDVEVALRQARSAVWRAVDELAAGGLAIIPPDFPWIERAALAQAALAERADREARRGTA